MIKSYEDIVLDLVAHRHEEEWFEFKVNWCEPNEIGQYISAISNSAALLGHKTGYFVWGIENNTHRIVGTEFDFYQDVKNEPLKHYLARKVSPDVGFDFVEITLEGKRLVVLFIPAANKMPTAFDEVRYIRIGSSKAKLIKYPEHESQLFFVLRHGFPTISNMPSEFQDLSFNKLFVYFESKGVPLSRRTFKKNLGLITEEGKYNILAQLLSDDSHITVRFALFAGKNKASAMYSVKEFGYTCILYSLDQVLDYGKVLNIPQADERDRETVRKEIPLFNEVVYKEAVINAFVHNRWIDGNAPMFTGFNDRLEILSRGVLPPNQTLDGFYAGESVPVNQALSDVFMKLHITEHTGRGIPRITEKYGREIIRFHENSIQVTIPYDKLIDEAYELENGSDVYWQIDNIQDEVAITQDNTQDEGINTQDKGMITQDNTQDKDINTQDNTQDEGINTQDKGMTTQDNTQDEDINTQDKGMITQDNTQDKLFGISDKIIIFCEKPRSAMEIAYHLGYKQRKSVKRYLEPLLKNGKIAMTLPDRPTSRNQKYIVLKEKK